MNRQRTAVALAVAVAMSVVVGACGATATPAPSTVALGGPSASVAATSVEPTATSSPSPAPSATATATATPSPTPTLAPTPAPTPVPWKSYTSKRFHYKMQYPPDWVVTPGNAEDSDMYDNYGYPYIYVSRDVVSTAVSISRTVSSSISYYKSHYKAKLLANQGIRLANGYSGRMLTYSGVDDGLKVVIKEIILGKGKIGYFLVLFGKSENAVADRTVFRKMYLTWRATP